MIQSLALGQVDLLFEWFSHSSDYPTTRSFLLDCLLKREHDGGTGVARAGTLLTNRQRGFVAPGG